MEQVEMKRQRSGVSVSGWGIPNPFAEEIWNP